MSELKKYVILTRVYETRIEVKSDNEKEALEEVKAMGDSIYEKESEQCNVVEENLAFKNETNGQ